MFLFAPIRFAFKIVNLLVTGAIVYLIVSGVQVVMASNAKAPRPSASTHAAAIIVMLPSPSNTVITPDFIGRLDETVSLFRSGVSKRIELLTSSDIAGTKSSNNAARERSDARQWLVTQGIPNADISTVIGTNPYAALRHTTLALHNETSIALVTDAINHLWIAGAASASGLHVVGVYPAAGSTRSFVFQPLALARESTGVALARIIGYANTTWVNG